MDIQVLLNFLKLQMFQHKKRLGQNFLSKSSSGIQKIVNNFSEIDKDLPILEIGPGKGSLSTELLKINKNVTAIEKDEELKPYLENIPELNIIYGDALSISCPNHKYNLIANIPYYITSKILFKYLIETINSTTESPPQVAIILVQTEFAEKVVTTEPKHNILSLSFQSEYDVSIVGHIDKKHFKPSPKVNSSILLFKKKKTNFNAPLELFISIIRKVFQQKKKTLSKLLIMNNFFTKELINQFFEEENLDPRSRPFHLSIKQWEKLTNQIKDHLEQESNQL